MESTFKAGFIAHFLADYSVTSEAQKLTLIHTNSGWHLLIHYIPPASWSVGLFQTGHPLASCQLLLQLLLVVSSAASHSSSSAWTTARNTVKETTLFKAVRQKLNSTLKEGTQNGFTQTIPLIKATQLASEDFYLYNESNIPTVLQNTLSCARVAKCH